MWFMAVGGSIGYLNGGWHGAAIGLLITGLINGCIEAIGLYLND